MLTTHCFAQKENFYKPDTMLVNSLLSKSKELAAEDPERSIAISLQAKVAAEQNDFKKGIALALKQIGNVHFNQGEFLEAISFWNQSIETYRIMNDLAGVSNILNNIGVIHSIQGDYAKALETYLAALKAAEQSGDKARIVSVLNNVGATYALKKETYDKALAYYLRALPISEAIKDSNSIGTTSVNIGEVYSNKGNSQLALQYYNKSLKVYLYSKNDLSIPYAYNAIAKEYKKEGRLDMALQFHNKALTTAQKVDNKLYIVQSLLGLANTYTSKNDHTTALSFYQKAATLGREINAIDELKEIYQGMSTSFANIKRYDKAFEYQTLFTNIKDTLYNIQTDKKLASLQFDFDLQKKQTEINLLSKDKILNQLELKRQKLAKNALIIGLSLVFLIAFILYRNYRAKVKINKILDRQKDEIEHLLLNILPAPVAKELQTEGKATPKNYDMVSVLFTDFKGFTTLAEKMTPQELVQELNSYFMAFDDIVEKYHLEKIKTIGDSYMCAGGIPTTDPEHPYNMVKAAFEMQDYINSKNRSRLALNLEPWEIRIGINAGPVVAGVVGKKKYAYDIWGSAVNIASRMESNGVPGEINISSFFYNLIKDRYSCKHRGRIYAKNVGEIDMYFIERITAPLVDKQKIGELLQ
jgi:class 3 adenylate cyclase